MNIFNISQELEDIFYQIEENGGEITPELEERLAINEELLHDKLDSYRRVYSKFLADSKVCKEEETRIAKLRKTKENQAERLKSVMLDAVQRYGATGKSGNKLVNLPDAKLYTKATACTEVDMNRSNILMQIFLDIYHISWEQDILEEQYGNLSNIDLINIINTKLVELYPNQEIVPFTIDDLYSLKINFNFSYSLGELNDITKFSLLRAWYDNAEISNNFIEADVNKTEVKNKIKDLYNITIANVVEHDSLIIK